MSEFERGFRWGAMYGAAFCTAAILIVAYL